MDSALLLKYFPDLTEEQIHQFELLGKVYPEWNEKINVISRKDVDSLYEKHILHSLGIAKVMEFAPGTKVLDIGTGGGFPGIPLAILFPEVHFTLIDSIGKKITVVNAVAEAIGLKNVTAVHGRAEKLKEKFRLFRELQSGFPKESPPTVPTWAFSRRNMAKSSALEIKFPFNSFPI